MHVSTDIKIKKTKKEIWAIITDIENASKFISAINKIEILNKPKTGVIGLKWKETRVMFGKEASEVMWITDALENEFYCTRAESHGSIYTTKLTLSEDKNNGVTTLNMNFSCKAQTLIAKILLFCMRFIIKSSMKKALSKDLSNIKEYMFFKKNIK